MGTGPALLTPHGLPGGQPQHQLHLILSRSMGTASAQKLGVEQLSRHFPMQGPFSSPASSELLSGVGGEPQILRHLQTLLCSLIPGITGKSIRGPHSGKPPRHTPAFMSLRILPQPLSPQLWLQTPWARTRGPPMTHAAWESFQVLLVTVT